MGNETRAKLGFSPVKQALKKNLPLDQPGHNANRLTLQAKKFRQINELALRFEQRRLAARRRGSRGFAGDGNSTGTN